MKFFKWFFGGILGLLVLLVGFAFLIPILYGDEIKTEITERINASVDADVAFGETKLTVFRDFPNLSLVVKDLVVDGHGVFDTIELASIKEFAVSVDFWSAISDGPIRVNGIELEAPRLNVITLKDGTTNTDIMRNVAEATDPAAAENSSVSIELDHYQIQNGELIYDDRAGALFAHITGLDHEGSGDFTATKFDLKTQTTIADLDFISGGIGYLKNATVNYAADLVVDTDAGTVTLADNALTLNQLLLQAAGTVGLPKEDGSIDTDIEFNSPQQDFKALWSVVPAVYTKDLTNLKTSGAFAVRGNIEGTYKPEPQSLPAFAIDLNVENASVQYPDLPKSLSAINIKAGIRSAGKDLADLLVDVERFSFSLGANPFSGSLRVRQGTTDPAFDLVAKGTLDLGDLSQAIPLEGVETIAGRIALDIKATGKASDASADLRAINSQGIAEMTGVVYDATAMPRVEIKMGTATFSGTEVRLDKLDIQAGKTDMKVNGVLTDPFALATETGTLGGKISLVSKYLDANEWLEEPVSSTSTPSTTAEVSPDVRPFDRFELDYEASVGKLAYDVYVLEDAKSSGKISPDALTLNDLDFKTAGSDISMKGKLDNLYGFAFDNEQLTGNLQLRSSALDLLAFSNVGVDPTSTQTASTTEATYLELPDNMSIRIATSVGKLIYDDIAVTDVNGVIAMANQSAVIENGTGKVLGGTVKIDGGYQYKGLTEAPTFDLKYDIQGASFRQAFEQLNTVQQLAPVAKFIDGSFNTNLMMSATLGKDMMPNLTSLNADGFIATLNATLANFPPLQKAADKLGLKQLEGVDLKNSKNWFSIENGTVTVQPFEVKWSGIDATIGGSHGLDQSMNYEIIALVPRALLAKNVAGAAANTGIDFLNGQASKLGLNLNVGEFVRVKIGMTGSIDDPKIDIKLLGTEGEGSLANGAKAALADAAKQARDSIERLAQAKFNEAKAEAESKARAVADSVRIAAETRARAAAEEAKAKAQQEANRLAQKAAEEAKAKAGEEAKRLAEEAAKKAGADAEQKAKDALKGILGKKKPN